MCQRQRQQPWAQHITMMDKHTSGEDASWVWEGGEGWGVGCETFRDMVWEMKWFWMRVSSSASLAEVVRADR